MTVHRVRLYYSTSDASEFHGWLEAFLDGMTAWEADDADDSKRTPQPRQRPEIHSSAPLQVADTGDGIAIKFSYEYAQELIESPESHLPPELHQRIVDVVFQRAFN